LPDVEHLEIE